MPSARALLVVLAALPACGDAVLGALTQPELVVPGPALSARNLVLSNDCAPEQRWIQIEGQVGAPAAPELHIIATQARAASVHVSRRAPLIVALSSPGPVDWTITASAGTALLRVIGVGDGSTFHLPAGVPLDRYPVHGAGGLGCGDRYPPSPGAPCNAYALIDGLERAAQRPLSSYVGCTSGARFELVDPLPPRWDLTSLPAGLERSPDGLQLRSTRGDQKVAVARATTPLWSGRWYFEVIVESGPQDPTNDVRAGIGLANANSSDDFGAGWVVMYSWAGQLGRNPGLPPQMLSGTPLAAQDRVGIAMDLDADNLWATINGDWFPGDPSTTPGLSVELYPGVLPLYPAIFAPAGFAARAAWQGVAAPPGFQRLDQLEVGP